MKTQIREARKQLIRRTQTLVELPQANSGLIRGKCASLQLRSSDFPRAQLCDLSRQELIMVAMSMRRLSKRHGHRQTKAVSQVEALRLDWGPWLGRACRCQSGAKLYFRGQREALHSQLPCPPPMAAGAMLTLGTSRE